jgi:hypothetical protein
MPFVTECFGDFSRASLKDSMADLKRSLEQLFNEVKSFIRAIASFVVESRPVAVVDVAMSNVTRSALSPSVFSIAGSDRKSRLNPSCRKQRLLSKSFLANPSNLLLVASIFLITQRRISWSVTSPSFKRSFKHLLLYQQLDLEFSQTLFSMSDMLNSVMLNSICLEIVTRSNYDDLAQVI